jgi:hypothetical protein
VTVRPYTSVYWNVDVLHIGSTPIYLAPTLLLLKSLTALSYTLLLLCYLYYRNTTLRLLRLILVPAVPFSCSSTLTSLLCNPYRCAEEIAELQPDARRGPRDDLFEQREAIAASSKTRANAQGGRRVHRLYVQACMPRGGGAVVPPIAWQGLRSEAVDSCLHCIRVSELPSCVRAVE